MFGDFSKSLFSTSLPQESYGNVPHLRVPSIADQFIRMFSDFWKHQFLSSTQRDGFRKLKLQWTVWLQCKILGMFCMQVLEIHPFQPSISLQFCSYCNASPWCIFRRPGTTTTHKYQWYAMNSLAARWSILWILFSGTRSWSLSTPISPKPLYPPTRNHHSTRWETRGYHLTQTSLVCGRLFLLQGVIYAHARHFLYIRLH